jgi:hypothetical protein
MKLTILVAAGAQNLMAPNPVNSLPRIYLSSRQLKKLWLMNKNNQSCSRMLTTLILNFTFLQLIQMISLSAMTLMVQQG